MSALIDTRSEAERMNAILLKYGREPDVTLWRNNTGQAKAEVVTRAHLERMLGWMVDATVRHGSKEALGLACQTRDLIRALLKEPQRFTRYGLSKGSSDIIGIVQARTPRPEANYLERGLMPGPLGVFIALEVKAARGVVSVEQQQFLDIVNRRGGIGRVVHDEDEAGRAIEEARAL